MIHWNVNGIKSHFNEMEIYLKQCTKIDILVLTETRIMSEEIENFKLKNYEKIGKCRKKGLGGGIMIFVHESLNYEIKDLEMEECESLACTIKTGCSKIKDFELIALYRPPNKSQTKFIKQLEKVLEENENKKVVLTGDININVLNEKSAKVNEYLNTLAGFNFTNMINGATREETKGGKIVTSCLDHFIVKNLNAINPVIIEVKMSDHYPIGLRIELNQQRKEWNKGKKTKYKFIEIIDQEKREEEIGKMEWKEITEEHNVEKAYEMFNKKWEKIRINSAKKIKVKANAKIEKEWNKGKVEEMVKNKNKMFQELKRAKNRETIEKRENKNKGDIEKVGNGYEQMVKEYKKYKNQAQKAISKAKYEHQRKLFQKAGSDQRKIWQTINEMTGRKVKPNVDETLRRNFKLRDTKMEKDLADQFSITFIRDIRNLDNNCKQKLIEKDSNDGNEKGRREVVKREKWTQITIDKLDEYLNKSLKTNKSPGYDMISMRDLKYTENKEALIHVINKSIEQSVVPKKLKTSIIRPLYKAGKKNDIKNYRPIQILSAVDKVLEKHIHTQLSDFLKDNDIISSEQFAYTEGKSAEKLLVKFSDVINEWLSWNANVMALFVDFSKAFDTIKTEVVLESLVNIGITGEAKNWIKDYLTNRKAVVRIDKTFSEEINWETGVPQGSLLGPTLYLITVNDMPKLVAKNTKIFMFADDTVLLAAHKDEKVAIKRIERDFKRLQKYTHDKNLTINWKKTKLIHFKKSGQTILNSNVKFHEHECLHRETEYDCRCGKEIEVVESIRYLGMQLDSNFKFNDHILQTMAKLRRGSYALNELKKFLKFEDLRKLYHAVVQSHLSYGLQTYGTASESYLENIEKLQDKIVNNMLSRKKQKRCTSRKELYSQANLLPFNKLYIYKQILDNDNQEFLKLKEQARTTRTNPTVNRFVSSIAINRNDERKRSHQIPKIFNTIPKEITAIGTKSKMKEELRKFLLDRV